MVKAVSNTDDFSNNDELYSFQFLDTYNSNLNLKVISTGDNTSTSSQFLEIRENGQVLSILEFRYHYSSGSTQKAIKFHRFVAVGFSGYFYLYDLSTRWTVLFLDLGGYFCDFYIVKNELLVAYNDGIYCLTQCGKIKWHNDSIGIDGVYISKIEGDCIVARGQIDPPDGWSDYRLDLNTGFNL